MKARRFLVLSALVALPTVIACGNTDPAPQQAPSAAPSAAPKDDAEDKAQLAQGEAKSVFKKKCIVCHGETGSGDGPGSAALDPKPRNFHDAAWQGGVTDEQITKTILGGGAAVGKSPIMPSNPELKSKPEVVKELVAMIRGFKQ